MATQGDEDSRAGSPNLNISEINEEKLLVLRRITKSSVTKISTFATNFKDGQDNIEGIKIRDTNLEKFYQKYDNIQSQLEEIDPEKYEADRELFEDSYYQVKTKLQTLITKDAERKAIKSHQEGQVPPGTPPNVQQPIIHVQPNIINQRTVPPQLSIPKFRGDVREWRSFYDMFNSMIHQDDAIPDCQKFLHLKTALEGEAAQIVSALTVTAENYTAARALLEERYENKQLIINAHLKPIFEHPILQRLTAGSLRDLLTCTKQNLRALTVLGLPVEHWDTMVIFIVKQKLDLGTRKQWELETNSKPELPTVDELYSFLDKRCIALETLNELLTSQERKPIRGQKTTTTASHVSTNRPTMNACQVCNQQHSLYQCQEFLAKSVPERVTVIKAAKLCFNCLKKNHSYNTCRSTRCKKCQGKHHTLIHEESRSRPEPNPVQEQSATTALTSSNNFEEVILPTAIIEIKDVKGEWRQCRALLDCASQSNFITTNCAKTLNCSERNVNIAIRGISQTAAVGTTVTDVTIKSRVDKFKRELTCIVIPKITTVLPSSDLNVTTWNLPDVQLADPNFYNSREIDVLVGAEFYLEIIKNGRITLGNELPMLQNTVFGWVVCGKKKIPFFKDTQTRVCNLTTVDLHRQIEKFWETEEVKSENIMSLEEEVCENHFLETHKRDETGRFEVKFALTPDGLSNIGESKELAYKRLQQMERKMSKNPAFKRDYYWFMKEYETLNHMQEINPTTEGGEQKLNFLPHHAVVREESTTTKLRVVFDGSAKTSTGVSLNDCLLVGPRLQQDLFNILLRFRQHEFVVTADICKMYRQVNMQQQDRDLQCILWRSDPQEPVEIFQLNTITYGTASAPYLAVRCLIQLAEDNKVQFPEASEIIRNDFYVDDLLTGADSITKLKELKAEVEQILISAGFELRKWTSNEPSIVTSDNNDEIILDSSQKNITRALGVRWNHAQDVLLYHIKLSEGVFTTKRQFLSEISRLFDPLGLLSPIIIRAKILMQQIWQLSVDWDDPLPEQVIIQFANLRKEITRVNRLKIPRFLLMSHHVRRKLHVFADASEAAYGVAIYIQSEDRNGLKQSRLVCAKSRVAPLKRLTIPRLELCAAVLAVRLATTVKQSLSVQVDEEHYWSDSEITLWWINSNPTKLKVFVAHRIAEIQHSTQPSQWHHVQSAENPADFVSRGVDTSQIQNLSLWWQGPNFLRTEFQPPSSFPACNSSLTEKEVKTTVLATTIEQELLILTECSSWTKLTKVIAWAMRFRHNCKGDNVSGQLTVEELDAGVKSIVRAVQAGAFEAELRSLRNNQPIKKQSKLLGLAPYLDEDILKVGGRLKNATIRLDQKHPTLLPGDHHVTRLLLRHYHLKFHHCGPDQLLALIRNRFWPTNGRNTVKGVIRHCIVCTKYSPKPQAYKMGDLPKERVTPPSRPFVTSGVDYAGPITIKENVRRGRPVLTKAYIAVFVCFSTTACHIELVSSLSTDAFLAAFRRFTSRRGLCATLYSDNGTNFVGANNSMRELYTFLTEKNPELTSAFRDHHVNWKFSPPRGPHFGGLWEAAVKALKRHFYKVTNGVYLTFEEATTLLAQIEALLNSRPLLPLSSSPFDLSVLTPSYFLIGDSLLEPLDADYSELKCNRLSRYQLIQQTKQHFWTRWRREYLQKLQSRTKWKDDHENCKKGDLVIVCEDNVVPFLWKMGRIVETHPGSDGVVRVATVKMATGLFKRPVRKLCPLFPDDSSEVKPKTI